MKYLKYNDFVNESIFRRKPDKKPKLISSDDIKKMSTRELKKYKQELEEEDKRLREISKQNKLKRRTDSKNMDDALNQSLSQYIDDNFSFQYSQYIWKSKDSNYEEIDIADFVFNGINIEPQYDFDSNKLKGYFFILNFIDRYGYLIEVPLFEDTVVDKTIDLEYRNIVQRKNKVMRGNIEDDDIDYNNPSSYPRRNGWLDLVPNDYKTIELLKELKSLLKEINDNLYK